MLPLERSTFKPMLRMLKPPETGSVAFFSQYIWSSFQFHKHKAVRPSEKVQCSWAMSLHRPTQPFWFPSKECVNGMNSRTVPELQRIYYTNEGSRLGSVTFAFGDFQNEIRSPPKGTYSVEPTKAFYVPTVETLCLSFCKVICMGMMQLASIVVYNGGLSGELVAKVTCSRKVVVHCEQNLNIAHGDKIVSAKVAACGENALTMRFLIYTDPN